MQHWHVGCSGFHYKPWKGVFYPEDLPQTKWFDFYAEHFTTLELNVTFYRFPQLSFLETWYRKSPEHFSFAVKAPRAITHYKQFVDAKQYITDFYDIVQKGLKDKTGCILFQLPPRMKYSEAKLEQIINMLDPAFRNVIEFRHESWWTEQVYKQLAEANITFCSISHPDLPDTTVHHNSIVYYRFHGKPQLYKSSYSDEQLKQVSDTIKKYRGVKEVFVYFNNDIDVAAVYNAKTLAASATNKTGK